MVQKKTRGETQQLMHLPRNITSLSGQKNLILDPNI